MTTNIEQTSQHAARPRRFLRNVIEPLVLAIMALLSACLSTAAMAQTAADDPPARVARLSDFSGQVWVYTPDAGDWIAAVRNQPLTSGDTVATDAGARAELQVGSTTLRVDASSEVEVAQLDDSAFALQLHSGSVAARVRTADAARELSVATDSGSFHTDLPGRYRFDYLDNMSGLSVYAGRGGYDGNGVALTVAAGQHALFWVDEQQVAQYALRKVDQDAFAAWVNERDASEDRYAAPAYVSPEMTGAEDLARYGSWEQTPDEGAVWIPSGVAVDWAPYSTGRWGYVRPWGWTWIDDAPWGFAPFHYGRWLRVRDRWCWAPGGFVARPIYAPALVGWVGGAGGVSVSIGGPPIGWFPLAPRDVYVPSYRYSERYVRAINVGSVRDAARIDRFVSQPPNEREFGNRRYPNAVTIVPTSVFTGRQPVAPAAAQVRATPWARELAAQPARVQALAAPPVAAPAPVRRADPRAVPPPPVAARENGGPPPAMRQPMPVRRLPPGDSGAPPPAAQSGPIRPPAALPSRVPEAPTETHPPPIVERRPLPGVAEESLRQGAPQARPQSQAQQRPPPSPQSQPQPQPRLQREQRPQTDAPRAKLPTDGQRPPQAAPASPDKRQTAEPSDRPDARKQMDR